MQKTNYLLITIASIAISCGNSSKDTTKLYPPPITQDNKLDGQQASIGDEEVAKNEINSNAANTENDGNRKFIRTANIHFRAIDVRKSTYRIEDIIHNEGGFVTYTKLTSNISRVTNTPISEDSTLESTYYVVVNQMTIRVADEKLDTTLKQIAPEVDFLDSRVITANDVTLQMYKNKKTIEKKFSKPLYDDGIYPDNTKESASLDNMYLQDQVDYSTIELTIYQRETIRRTMLANEKNIDTYQVGFFSQLKDSFSTGIKYLKLIILFTVKLWWLILVICAGVFIARRLIKK